MKGVYMESKRQDFRKKLTDIMAKRFSKSCISFMMQCLAFDENSRPSAKQLQTDAWLKSD